MLGSVGDKHIAGRATSISLDDLLLLLVVLKWTGGRLDIGLGHGRDVGLGSVADIFGVADDWNSDDLLGSHDGWTSLKKGRAREEVEWLK